MPGDISLQGARAGVSLPLTNLAQGVVQPEYVMRLLFPLAEVGTYGGTVIQFDDSDYEDVLDDRADDTPYPEVQAGYEGKPFKLKTKGLRYRVPDKRRKEMENLRINWGQKAVKSLINKAGLRHEIEAATIATNVALYNANNRITLSAGSRFGDAGTNPDSIIRAGKSAVSDQIGLEPNVAVIGRRVFDGLAAKYAANFTSTNTTPGLRSQLTLETLAGIYGFRRVAICDAIVKINGVRTKVFGNHFVMGFANPDGLNGDNLPYKPDGAIDMVTPAYGYTYVMQGQPVVQAPWYDKDRKATVYDLDFDRQVVTTGIDAGNLITHGYIIANAA
jgi:hypothetical protein